MARIPQPREVAELKGSDRKNPQRYRKQPAKSGYELGLPPDYMEGDAKAVWFELDTYAAAGVLTGGDRLVLEVTATLIAEFRRAPAEFSAAKIGHLVGCLARLGLTPADRQRIGVEKPKDENEFNEF